MVSRVFCILFICTAIAYGEPLGGYWGTAEQEAEYYKVIELPVPKQLKLEAGCFEALPDGRLAVGTRRGEIYFITGAYDKHPKPKFHLFADGLDEMYGLAWRDGSLYVTQRTEVTRITDTDKDGRADSFETISDKWGFKNYHEFAFGSKFDRDGNIWVALGLSSSYHSRALFRGWALKISPDGTTTPMCSGLRSPCGIGVNAEGVMFYAESQGPWNGSCSLKHLKPGGFMGHPISYNWYQYAPNMGPKPVEPNSGSRQQIEKKRVKELVPYAVVFPYIKMGRQLSGFMLDKTGGKFGPFENQIFVGDYSLSIVMRATTEEINGVWQGACYPFNESLSTGLLSVAFTPKGQLIAGGTNRGWPVRGIKSFVLERIDWTGKVPFEIKEINAKPDGFKLTFTQGVDPKVASNPDTYKMKTYTHVFQKGYGSPEVDHTTPQVLKAIVAADGLSVRLKVKGLVEGHVHDFNLSAMRSKTQRPLLHVNAYYTLNEIPKR